MPVVTQDGLLAALGGLFRVVAFGWLMACGPIAVDAFEEPDDGVAAGDTCPDDAVKVQPGVCGCGIPDDDFDLDGTLDCLEECPDNAGQTVPTGACGCSALGDTLACTDLRNAVRNLYTFDGAGLQVVDSKGGENGTLLHVVGETPLEDLQSLQVNGRLNLDGFGSYVELPVGIISSLVSATFEVWIAWRGGAFWPRIFDFGSNDGGTLPVGQTYLFLTPSNSATNKMRVAYSIAGGAEEIRADAPASLPAGSAAEGSAPEHVAVVIDSAGGSMRLYQGGEEVTAVGLAGDLTALDDINNWLGRSNFFVDPPLYGTLIEFRIYSRPLSAAQINTSFRAGPGALN